VLRFAAEAVKAGVPADIIKQRLDERYPAVQAAGEPQPPAMTGGPPLALIAFAEVVRELLSEQRDAALQEGRALRSAVDDLRNVVVESAATDRKTIVEQAEIIGKLKAELEAMKAARAPVEASGVPESSAPPTGPPNPFPTPLEPTTNGHGYTPWWRRWRAWLAAGLVVAVVGSASCQASGQRGGAKNVALCRAVQEAMGSEAAVAAIKDSAVTSSETIYRLVLIAEKVC